MAENALNREMLAQVRRIQVRTDRMVTSVLAGGYSSVFRGAGIEFDEVREFAEGDDLRAVDWNVTARAGRPFVKKFMEERELTVLLLLDVSASTAFASARADEPDARSVAQTMAVFCGCIAFAAARNHDKVGMIAFGDGRPRYLPAKKGRAHALRLIRDAVALPRQGRTDLAAALAFAGRVQRRQAVVFVVSDFLAPLPERELRLLAQRHDVIAVRVRDRLAGGVDRDGRVAELPARGLLHVRDLETGALRVVDTGSARVRSWLVAQWQQERAQFVEAVRRAGVDVLDVSTRGSVGDPIVRFFRMRERRGGRR